MAQMILMSGLEEINQMIGDSVTKKINMTKFGNAFVNSVIVFFMIGSVSAVFAVLVHSILFGPPWVGIVLTMFVFLFITMLAVEYGMERDDD